MGMHGAPGAGCVLGDGVGSGQSLAMGLVTQQLNSNKNYRQVGGFVSFVPVAVCMLRLPRAVGHHSHGLVQCEMPKPVSMRGGRNCALRMNLVDPEIIKPPVR